MRPRTRIIVGVIGVAAVVGWPVVSHYRAKHQVIAYRRSLAAQGEKMTVAELVPQLPADRDNGAAWFLSAGGTLGSIHSSNEAPTMTIVEPGRVLVAWRQRILPTNRSTNHWTGLRKQIEAKTVVLGELREALRKPALAFNLNYSQGFSLTFAHWAQLKQATRWLSQSAMLALYEGRIVDAMTDLQAMTALVSGYRDEALTISSLVRIAMAAISVSTAWQALQSPDLMDEPLGELQSAWQALDFLTQAEAALSMERAMGAHSYAAMRASSSTWKARLWWSSSSSSTSGLAELMELSKGVLENPSHGLEEIVMRYPGYWSWRWWGSYEEELAQMRQQQAGLIALREVKEVKCFAPAIRRLDQAIAGMRFFPSVVGYANIVPRYIARLRAVEMQRCLLVTAIALKRFRIRHGRYPEALTQLVPDYFAEAPRDPIDGQPLRYRAQEDGGFLLYSIGENGVDDGGDTSNAKGVPNQAWDWLKGRDAVWPQAAKTGD